MTNRVPCPVIDKEKAMLIKEATYKTCGECERNIEQISPEVYGCDNCRQPIDLSQVLQSMVFRNSGDRESEHLHFCSWSCVLKKLPKVKCDYFITLPNLHFDAPGNKKQAKDFFRLLRAATKK